LTSSSSMTTSQSVGPRPRTTSKNP
jgi:hypothetical protein